MTPSVVPECGEGWGCLALGRFSHSPFNQEQTEALRRGWGQHSLTPLLCCEIILKQASLQCEASFRLMSHETDTGSVELTDGKKLQKVSGFELQV